MEDKINQTLAQLEKDLQEINSAKNQVEKTVKASTELMNVVGEYVSSVKALCVCLQAWESELRIREGSLSHEYEEAISRVNSTCTEIISSFGGIVEKTSDDFKSKTSSTLEKFTEQNKILTEHVQDLNALKNEIKKATSEIQTVKESLSQISKDLKESQESQDAVLNDLKQKSDEIIGKADGIAEKIKSLHEKADSINSKLSQVNSLSHEVKTACEQIHSTLKSSSESLLKTLETSKNDTAKNININRWIIIAAFIILLIIHFIK